MSEFMTGLTCGGEPWTPEFITAVDPTTCIGCGRCYKVCSRDVFDLRERSDMVEDDDDDDYDEDDVMMVMAVKDADDCIGCGACIRVCPKNCHSHAAKAI
jgi:Nif-specific ferredoxin III